MLSQFEVFFIVFFTIWVMSFATILFFECCHNLNFWVLSQFKVLSFCYNSRFWVLSQFEFFRFMTIWVFLVLLQFEFLSFSTIWVFKFHHNLSFWVLSQFEFFQTTTEDFPLFVRHNKLDKFSCRFVQVHASMQIPWVQRRAGAALYGAAARQEAAGSFGEYESEQIL